MTIHFTDIDIIFVGAAILSLVVGLVVGFILGALSCL